MSTTPTGYYVIMLVPGEFCGRVWHAPTPPEAFYGISLCSMTINATLNSPEAVQQLIDQLTIIKEGFANP